MEFIEAMNNKDIDRIMSFFAEETVYDRPVGVDFSNEEKSSVANVTLDVDSLAREYRQAMGWDPDSGQPEESTLEKLGLTQLVKTHG